MRSLHTHDFLHMYVKTLRQDIWYILNILVKKTCVSLFSIFNIFPFFPQHGAYQLFGLKMLFPINLCIFTFNLFFYRPNNTTHTHTQIHTLPTLLLLTAVCSETVKSQRCHLSGEPLIELFHVVELMQLFFSGQ